jgi:hypothetical protein
MSKEPDMLESVIKELNARTGTLPKLARDTKIPYDSLLRIKNRENDIGYSKVKLLHAYFASARGRRK